MSNEPVVLGDDSVPQDYEGNIQKPTVLQYSDHRPTGTYDPVTDTVTVQADHENLEAQINLGSAVRELYNEVIGEPSRDEKEAIQMLTQGYRRGQEINTEDEHFNIITSSFVSENKPMCAVLADGVDPKPGLRDVSDGAGYQAFFEHQFEESNQEEALEPLINRREEYEEAVQESNYLEDVDSMVRILESGRTVTPEDQKTDQARQIVEQINQGAQHDFRLEDRRQSVQRTQERRGMDPMWETEFSDIIKSL